jgi:hypothetical protein
MNTTTHNRGPFIVMHSSRRWHFTDPRVEDVDIEDMALGLAHISRFTGQAHGYSVATHSCHVADIVVFLGRPDLELEALVHDAHEAYVGDVSSPLKKLLPDYQRIEALNAATVRAYFGLPPETSHMVARADLLACHDEGSIFVPDAVWTGPFSGLQLTFMDPIDAMERWDQRVRGARRNK